MQITTQNKERSEINKEGRKEERKGRNNQQKEERG
jgi:hypothetical protein